MKNIRKKALIRDILKVFLFTINIVGIIFSSQLFYFFYRLKKSGKADEIGKLLEKGTNSGGFKNTYKTTVNLFIVCSIIVTMIVLYLLYKLIQNMSQYRSIDIGIKYILGYRKKRVLIRELIYGVSYILYAEVLANLLSIVLFKWLCKVKSVASMLDSADMELYSAGICVLSVGVVLLAAVENIVVRVQREYKY